MTNSSPSASPSSSTVAAVVVTFHRPAGLKRTIAALEGQGRKPDHIIVVDNGDDGDAAATYGSRADVIVIETGDNLGAAGGFQRGLEAAQELGAGWAYLLNDDDVPLPISLARLVERAGQGGPNLVGVAGYAVADGAVRTVGAHFSKGLRYPTPEEQRAPEHSVDVVTFSGLLVQIEATRAAGGVRGEYFMMWEEFDLCLRLRQRGGELVVLTEPLVDLTLHGSAVVYPPWRGYYEARNGVITLRSFNGHGAWPWMLKRQVKFGIAALRLPQPTQRISLRLRGLYDGLRGRSGQTVKPK